MLRVVAVLALLGLAACGGSGWRFTDLWLTPDQQGRLAFERGDWDEAAGHFEDPLWKGTALYLDQRFEAALGELSRVDTAEGWFRRGNALAHLERYEEAVAAYRRALEIEPGFEAAEANLEYLEPFLPLQFEGGQMGTQGRDAGADDIVFDADAERLEEEGVETTLEGDAGMLTEAQLAEIWLRQVDTSPAVFLRNKFAYQVSRSGEPEGKR